jgi:hypothetical protein
VRKFLRLGEAEGDAIERLPARAPRFSLMNSLVTAVNTRG